MKRWAVVAMSLVLALVIVPLTGIFRPDGVDAATSDYVITPNIGWVDGGDTVIIENQVDFNFSDAVRYVKNCIKGSTANGGNHWAEIQAMNGSSNVALKKSYIRSDTGATVAGSYLTDGVFNNSYVVQGTDNSYQCVTVDLGALYMVDSVVVKHYNDGSRSYHNNVTSVGSVLVTGTDNLSTVLYDSGVSGEYVESANGTTFYHHDAIVLSASFGGLACQNVVVQSEHSIACEVPAGGAGSVDVTIADSSSSNTLMGAYRYFELERERFLALGDELKLIGDFTGLQPSDFTVDIDGVSCANISIAGQNLTCDTPPHINRPAELTIGVSLAGQTGTLSKTIYFSDYVGSNITNHYGGVTGGQTLTINGGLDLIRYVKNCTNGSTANTSNHFVEIEAWSDGTNVALGKPSSINDGAFSETRITDGAIDRHLTTGTGLNCITVDLGAFYQVDEVKVWHYFSGNSRIYKDNILSVGAFNVSGSTALSSVLWNYPGSTGYTETSSGESVTPDYSVFAMFVMMSMEVDGVICGSPVSGDASSLSCIMPAHGAGAVAVAIKANETVVAEFPYNYVDFSPTTGASGSTVTFSGAGFIGLSATDILVEFDGVAATDVTIVDDETFTVTAPNLNTNGLVDVDITIGTDNWVVEDGFTYGQFIALTVDKHDLTLTGGPNELIADHLTVNVVTDGAAGYSLGIESSAPNLTCQTDPTKQITALSSSAGAMVDNHWGYSVDTNLLSPITPTTWTGLTDDLATIKTFPTATDSLLGDDTFVWFGMRISYSLPTCNYSGEVTFTAIAGI